MSNAVATNFLLRNLNTTSITNDTAVTDTLIFTTSTLVILNRTEDTLTKKTISFRLVCTVVDGFWLQHFTSRCCKDRFWRSKTNRNLIKSLLSCIVNSSHNNVKLCLINV